MQNKNIKKASLIEALVSNDTNIDSYAQLVKLLSGYELEDLENLLQELKNMAFIEDEDTLYNKLPMSVFYKQLPVVNDGDVLVKVVLMQQADGLVLIVPENVVDTYQDLMESPENITDKNNMVSLYAEVYNFDSSDQKLQDLIKSVYISSGSSLKPFELKDDLAKAGEQGTEAEDGTDFDFESEAPAEDGFNDIDLDLPDVEDIATNESAYKKFKKQSNVLEKLIKNLYKKANDTLKENVRTKFFNKVLVIEVNNKVIYQKYGATPALAKKLLSNFGESIKKSKGTQLVDSFSLDGKRYFVVAENLANNYWYVKGEEIEKLTGQKTYIEANSRAVIKLEKSEIRKESRKLVPYKVGRKTVFVGSLM